MPRLNCEGCHDEIPAYNPAKVYVSEVGRGEIPTLSLNWLGVRNLSPEALKVVESDPVRAYLEQLRGLEGRQVPVEALLPRFKRDREACGQFVVPSTQFTLSIDNPNTRIPQARERAGLAIVRLWTDRMDMGYDSGVHIRSVGTIATIAVGRELPKHL